MSRWLSKILAHFQRFSNVAGGSVQHDCDIRARRLVL
jgi:hypothetical protein